jgi:hypothetical protein
MKCGEQVRENRRTNGVAHHVDSFLLEERRLGSMRTKFYSLLGKPQGTLGVWLGGHREYVGGLWEQIGKLQFDFIVEAGLKPEHVFLDVACGALRGGRHFIAYLNCGNYLGLEKERSLIRAGIRTELGHEMLRTKAPELVISDTFEFERFTKKPEFALAQSLFTHLTADDIKLCMAKLRTFVSPRMRFYATFQIGEPPGDNPSRSHAHRGFWYSRETAEEFGRDTGWRAKYIGEWRHPRNQKMMEYIAD